MKYYFTLQIIFIFLLIFSSFSLNIHKKNLKHNKTAKSEVNNSQQNTQNQQFPNKIEDDSKDFNSVSNFDQYTTKHFHLFLNIDIENQKIQGLQTLTLENLKFDEKKILILDVYKIKVISVDFYIQNTSPQIFLQNKKSFQNTQSKIPLDFKYTSDLEGTLGTYADKLEIFLDNEEITPYYNQEPNSQFKIIINYETTKEQTALSYLTKEQTESKELSYIFSQCESVACRSLAPFQDTPSVKSTYTAEVVVPQEYNVFMSANKISEESFGENLKKIQFALDIVIPSYLVAIVVGFIEEVEISDRVFLITEPQNLDYYSQVLEDSEQYLQTVEEYLTPYQWGVYKVVALPNTFPYAGMENPLLTFISPVIITHDKALMNVIVHEIAHSWFGNTVTCSNWENLWLNEGLTNFVENKVQGILNGDQLQKFQNEISQESLTVTIQNFMNTSMENMTSLKPTLKNTHPDDYVTSIPYDKGAQFMIYLESVVGEQQFQEFLQHYLNKYESQSVTPQDFKSTFYHFFKQDQQLIKQIDWDQWIYGTGQSPVKLDFSNELSKQTKQFAKNYIENRQETDISEYENFHFLQKYLFVKEFISYFALKQIKLSDDQMDNFQQDFQILESEYATIKSGWLETLIYNREILSKKEFKQIDEFISNEGLGGYANNVYKALILKGYTEFAKEKYDKYKPMYHIINQDEIQQLFYAYTSQQGTQFISSKTQVKYRSKKYLNIESFI